MRVTRSEKQLLARQLRREDKLKQRQTWLENAAAALDGPPPTIATCRSGASAAARGEQVRELLGRDAGAVAAAPREVGAPVRVGAQRARVRTYKRVCT